MHLTPLDQVAPSPGGILMLTRKGPITLAADNTHFQLPIIQASFQGNKEPDITLGSVKGVTPAPLPRILIHNLFSPP